MTEKAALENGIYELLRYSVFAPEYLILAENRKTDDEGIAEQA